MSSFSKKMCFVFQFEMPPEPADAFKKQKSQKTTAKFKKVHNVSSPFLHSSKDPKVEG